MLARVLLTAVLAFTLGCEKLDHESIDKWARTAKGPGKLRKALADESIDPDLSAHAAAQMVKRDDPDVFAVLDAMTPGRRTQVIAKLAPRLWDIARVEAAKDLPGAPQTAAKDALVRQRRWADEVTRQQ